MLNINLFPLVLQIKSRSGFVHFKRWQILKTPWFALYFHAIYKEDLDLYLHDHPWNFASFILKGSYTEQLENKEIKRKRFSFCARKAEIFHKIKKLHSPVVYTIFLTGKRKRVWGYDVNGEWIDHVTYRKKKIDGEIC